MSTFIMPPGTPIWPEMGSQTLKTLSLPMGRHPTQGHQGTENYPASLAVFHGAVGSGPREQDGPIQMPKVTNCMENNGQQVQPRPEPEQRTGTSSNSGPSFMVCQGQRMEETFIMRQGGCVGWSQRAAAPCVDRGAERGTSCWRPSSACWEAGRLGGSETSPPTFLDHSNRGISHLLLLSMAPASPL